MDDSNARSRLAPDRLAFEANAPISLVDDLVAAGLIVREADGTHDRRDIPKVRLAHALASRGIGVDALVHEIRGGGMPFEDIPRFGINPLATGRTFAEFAASFGSERAAQLPALYSAFGLAAPPPERAMRADEELALTEFLELWSMIDERPEVALRAARIAGEGMRKLVVGTIDLVDEFGGSPPPRMRRGLSRDEAVEPMVRQADMMNALLAWLRERHTEQEVFGRIVAFTEASLARQGQLPAPPIDPPAIAFVDLTSFTERTVFAGDQVAAEDATTLQVLAQAVVARHQGRIIKALGDGIMLRFESAAGAVIAVEDLMASIEASGLPAAHAGIASGSFVVRDGDVYGHVVNLASRLSGQAGAGELLVNRDSVPSLSGAGIRWEARGTVLLKGIDGPVAVVRVVN